MNYTYLLKCADDTLYCGWTNQLDKRLKAHNDGKGAKYTKARRPVSLAYYEIFETKEEAMRRRGRHKKAIQEGQAGAGGWQSAVVRILRCVMNEW